MSTRTRLTLLTATTAVVAMAMTGCVAGEGTPAPEPTEGAEWSDTTLTLDFATYNPLSLIIKDQGWLEAELGDDVTVEWVQSAGSNKANEARLKQQQGLNVGYLKIVEPARRPDQPLPNRTLQIALVGGALSLVAGVVLAFIFEFIESLKPGSRQ
jgi:hypothetical protein